MGIEQHISEPGWESDWRAHEEAHLGRPRQADAQTDMPPLTDEQQVLMRTAYENLVPEVQVYVDVTQSLRTPGLAIEQRKRYEGDRMKHLTDIIRDENLSRSLIIYENTINQIRMKS